MSITGTAASVRWAREYETIYILRPDVDPDDADKVAQRITEVVSRLGGTLTRVDNWGKRKLAYPIAKRTRGIFVYVSYLGYSDLVAELERNLHMLDSVIRWQTIRVRDRVDPSTVQIDPEEVKFLRIEQTEEEEEESVEERLGMANLHADDFDRARSDDEGGDDEGAEEPSADEEGSDRDDSEAESEGEGGGDKTSDDDGDQDG